MGSVTYLLTDILDLGWAIDGLTGEANWWDVPAYLLSQQLDETAHEFFRFVFAADASAASFSS